MNFNSLKTRLTLFNALIFISAYILIVFFVNYIEKQNAFNNAEAKATILLKHNLAIHSYINNKLKPTLFALTETTRNSDYFDPIWMSSTYAVRDIDRLYRQNGESSYYYKEAAINARSPENEADDFEQDFIQKLNSDKSVNTIKGVRNYDNKPYFFIMIRGESMEKGCMRCHSTPAKAPANLVKIYGGTRSFNRSIDQVVSAISIRLPLELAYRDANVLSAKLCGILVVLLLVTFTLQSRMITLLILTPLKRLKTEAESITNNAENLGLKLPPFNNKEMDEIAISFNNMSSQLKELVVNLDDTVRERTAKLSESEAKYHFLFENMTNGFALHEMIYDAHGNPSDYRFIEVNSAFEKITGLKASDILGRTVLDTIPDIEKSWIETYDKVAQGLPISFEKFSKELGKHFQIWAFSPQPGFFATSFNDITEHKKAEEALSESRHFLDRILDLAPNLIYIYDLAENRNVYANREVKEFLGHNDQQLQAMGPALFDNILHPDDINLVASHHARMTSAGDDEVVNVEYRMKHSNGEWRWLRSRDILFSRDEKGAGCQILGSTEDITESKMVEELIANTLEFQQVLLNSIPSPVFYKNAECVYIGCNRAFEEYLGLPSEQIFGKSVYDLAPAELAAKYDKADRELLNNPGVQTYEASVVYADGTRRDVIFNKATYKNSEGKLMGIIGVILDITERKLMEDKLQREKIFTNTLLDNITDGVVACDADGTLVLFNRASCEWHGINVLALSPEEWGKHYDIYGSDGTTPLPTESIPLVRAFRGEIVRNAAMSIVAEGQPPRHILADGAPFFDINHNLLGAVVVMHDITESRKAEDALRETKAILQAAMDCSPAGIAIANSPDGRLRYVNDAGLLIRGGDRQSIVNDVGIDQYVASWQLLDLDGRLLRTDEVPLARAIIYGETNSREFIIRDAEGVDRVVHATAAPIKDTPGNITAGIVVFTDITDSKQAEIRMKSLTQRLQLATTSAHLGIWDWNVKGNTMIWDDRMFELYGVTRESFPNSIDAWMNGLHPEDKESAIAECQAALNGEKEFDTEFRVFHPDGAVKHVRAKGLVLRGADGTAERMLGINYDISGSKHAEEEKHKLENQLQQAQKMESVGRLAGGVAHDFNNMLGVIIGHAELGLMHLDPTNPVCTDLEEISRAAERSADLTRQLLAFARRQVISPKVIDLNNTVNNMLKMLQRLIGEDIQLAWQPSPGQCQIKMDPSQIDQILANLCVNARDAIEDTGRIIIETGICSIDADYCAANPESTPGNYVRLVVSDNGKGMDQETLVHIFEPFYTTKEKGKGTGLGMATVYGVVKQNNGFINIYSETGKGATFSIHLPHYVADTLRQQNEGDSPAVPRGRETVLLVEDEAAMLKITAVMLEKQGYTVLKADSSGLAIELAREHHGEIHLLMTDVIMPEMNGRDLAKNILSLRPGMKRLFMSGYTADVIAHHGVLDDGVHFIQKPFSLPNMAVKLREVLDGI